jgi:tetratricopeptide (TPR) repeat protein
MGLVALLLAAAIAIQVVRDRGWVPYEPPNPTLWVQSGPLMQRLSLSYANLMADVYWIRAVVYYGGERRRDDQAKNYEGLYPLLNMVTALDPHFIVAYRFGAIFLTEAYPQGPGRPDQAIQLLERGIERDNGRWEYFHDIGFVYYWWLHDYQKAGEWFLRGSERPNAASWLKALAATTMASGGRRDSSRQLWAELLKSDMEFIHGQAEQRLMQLDAMDMIDELTPVVQRFVDREHRLPASWQELATAEHLAKVPADPTGVPFVFDPKIGHIEVSKQSTLSPLPVSPSTPQGPR